MSKILAIDYGKARTGVAITDSLQIIASALDTVKTQDLIVYLEKIILVEKVEILVVGLPITLDNKMNEIEQDIQQFIMQLAKLLPNLKIERIDERFTSKLASASILSSGIRKKQRQDKALVDQVSATIILQSYLNSKV